MAAKKHAPVAETAPDVSAPEPPPQPEPAPEPAPEPEPVPPPVHTYKAPRPTPFRAGGHVLTERGWEIDPAPPEQEK